MALGITLNRVSGVDTFKDGYVDNLSLVLTPRPLFLPVVLWP